MRRVAALLAAVLTAVALGACGGDGAEPGAPRGATLVLDFQPNAVHAGLYAAKARGYFEDEGIDLEIQEPTATADGAKLLAAGRADFAILDINDFGIARERGLDIVAIAAIVQRPLASVIATDRNEIRTPADLEGKTIGVTGVPSDDAVLDTILAEGNVDPNSVERRNIGFESVPLLASGRVDAATAFWNAEGVDLERMGIPTREFRVDEFGAPHYPELVVTTTAEAVKADLRRSAIFCRFSRGLDRAYSEMVAEPQPALDNLLSESPDLDRAAQEAQFAALTGANAFSKSSNLHREGALGWLGWALNRGLVHDPSIRSGFKFEATRTICVPSAPSEAD